MPTASLGTKLSTPFWEFHDTGYGARGRQGARHRLLSTPFWEFLKLYDVQEVLQRKCFLLPFGSFLRRYIKATYVLDPATFYSLLGVSGLCAI